MPNHHESAAAGSCQLQVAPFLVVPCFGQDCAINVLGLGLRLTVARQRTAQRDVDGQSSTNRLSDGKEQVQAFQLQDTDQMWSDGEFRGCLGERQGCTSVASRV